ncbi:DUF2318 domain-containing protein [Candidatus Kaiserbacteria bacterium]|nr:DUF2318 domain-containing protein [Candidatus Kaiserbacteria bacterium]
MLKKLKSKKPEWAIEKHKISLKGTGFERCASCPGTAGKVREDGTMCCGRCGPVVKPITLEQAKGCNGISPILLPPKKKKMRVSNHSHR